MLLYYITDRRQFPGSEAEKREWLLRKIAEAAQAGVDFIQLREKDLTARELERLAREAVEIVRAHPPRTGKGAPVEIRRTRILINSRADVAIAVGAGGVHLTANDVPASEVRAVLGKAAKRDSGAKESAEIPNVIGVSCHTAAEVRMAGAQGADFVVFAPVFEKSVVNVAGSERRRELISHRDREEGLRALREACAAAKGIGSSKMPVVALGGVTLENARECIAAGAAGIAGIRLFQENDVAEVVSRLRGADMLA
jgi:thiamine-phosphate pyrophosphorylase